MHSKPIDASHTANIGQGPYQAKEVKDIIRDSEDDPRERGLGDILPQGHFAPNTFCPTDILPHLH